MVTRGGSTRRPARSHQGVPPQALAAFVVLAFGAVLVAAVFARGAHPALAPLGGLVLASGFGLLVGTWRVDRDGAAPRAGARDGIRAAASAFALFLACAYALPALM